MPHHVYRMDTPSRIGERPHATPYDARHPKGCSAPYVSDPIACPLAALLEVTFMRPPEYLQLTEKPIKPLPYPRQQNQNLRFKRACDFRAQRFIKHPHISYFHSLAEYYHAALLEGDVAVERFVPQPYRLRFGRDVYIPDVYYERDGQRFVVELKPEGKMDEELRVQADAFFRSHGITFLVMSNESVYAQSIAAENWLKVVRWLLTYAEVDTQHAQLELIQLLLDRGEITYGEIADLGHRASRLLLECAVHRLLHSGEIQADFDQQFFGMETRLWIS